MPATNRASNRKGSTQPKGSGTHLRNSSRDRSDRVPERDTPQKKTGSTPTAARSVQQPENMGAFLTDKMIGVFTARVSKITLTSCGRSLREEGVKTIMQSIRDDGWVPTSYLAVTLMNDGEEGVLERGGDSQKLQYRCLDGNHRLEALRRLDTKRGVDSEVPVHVYRSLGNTLTESTIANRE